MKYRSNMNGGRSRAPNYAGRASVRHGRSSSPIPAYSWYNGGRGIRSSISLDPRSIREIDFAPRVSGKSGDINFPILYDRSLSTLVGVIN